MTNIFNTYPRLDPSQVEAMEKFVGLSFPEDYRAHLLEFNGGECERNVFTFVENGKETQSDVHWFFAIHDGEDDNLKSYIEILKVDDKRLPRQMLPIASDSFGNLICVSCDGDDRGKVYFWDHEKEVDYTTRPDTDYSNLYFIANSFEEFINGLEDESKFIN